MQLFRKPHPLAMFSVWFLIVFVVLFPKGGIKVGGLPLTWGYLYLACTAPVLLLVRVLMLPLRLPLSAMTALGLLVPIQVIYIYTGLVCGVSNSSYAFSMFVGFFALPWIFLAVYSGFLPYIDGVRMSRYFCWCVFLAAAWGIFLFFWRPYTGRFIEVPYLTVNAADYGELEHTKHISRGFFLKLISTYNNGNLYGVATLILYPLYQVLERVRWRRAVVTLALLLTLARTVWAGLVVAEALPLLVLLSKQITTFPVLYLGKAVKRFVALGVTICLVFVAMLFNTSALGFLGFLLDPTAGGRAGELTWFSHASFLPERPINGLDEIVYASITLYMGWTGFFGFTLMMISPILVLFTDRSLLRSPVKSAAFQGLIIYAVLAWSDGAFVLIPVMAFYWFAYMVFLFGWPNEQEVLAAQPAHKRFRSKLSRYRPRLTQPVPTM